MGNEFHYRSDIGQLNVLEKSSRIDITFSVHQCAHFSENPKKSHASAVKNIGHYLKGTTDKGLILKPDTMSSFECCVDSDFAGNWRAQDDPFDSVTSKSRTGWVIEFAAFPIDMGFQDPNPHNIIHH